MAPLDSMAPVSENDLREAFHSPPVRHFLELAARDIVRRNRRLAADSKGRAVYDSRMNATELIDVFDPHLQRAVQCKVRVRITVEPDMDQYELANSTLPPRLRSA
jgi:hypothetical protein